MGTLPSLSRSATATALHVSELVLFLFGLLLVAGLIGEYSPRWKSATRAFELLVIIGVAGELVADGGIFLFSEHLQTIEQLRVGKLDQEVITAEKAARSASQEAAVAQTSAARAIARASAADRRASQDEREAAELRKLAEDERLARVKIEEAVAWRRLTKQQRTDLGSRLSSFEGQLALTQYNWNDVEAFGFATDIALTLQLARWRVTEPLAVLKGYPGLIALGTNPPLARGVVITSTADKHSQQAADGIRDDVASLGFDCTRSPTADPRPTPTVFVSVEPRPEGPQGEAKLKTRQKAK